MDPEYTPKQDQDAAHATASAPVDALGNPVETAGDAPPEQIMTAEEVREYMKDITPVSPEQQGTAEIRKLLDSAGVTEQEADDFRKAIIMDERFHVGFDVLGGLEVLVRSRTVAEQRAVLTFADTLRRESRITTQAELNEVLQIAGLLVQVVSVGGVEFGTRYGLPKGSAPSVAQLDKAYAQFSDTADVDRLDILSDCLRKFTLKEMALRKALALPDFWPPRGPGR